MALQVRSSARSAERRRTAVVQSVIWVCALLCLLPENSARAHAQSKSAGETGDRFLFKITDSKNDLPIPEATVSLVYWRRKDSAEEKKEIELKTDKNGVAEFPRVTAEKFAVSVIVKGYKPFWRWIRSNGSEELIRIRLEKWASTPR